jgi:hypothetical protein
MDLTMPVGTRNTKARHWSANPVRSGWSHDRQEGDGVGLWRGSMACLSGVTVVASAMLNKLHKPFPIMAVFFVVTANLLGGQQARAAETTSALQSDSAGWVDILP